MEISRLCRRRAISILSLVCCNARWRIAGLGLPNEPYLYSWSWKRLGLIAPGRTPYWSANVLMSSVLRTPSGQSHRTCSATVGQTPVSRCTWPASLNFSSVVVAAAGWMNFPNRVPVLAKPQDGSSMRKDSIASNTRFLLPSSMADLSLIFDDGGYNPCGTNAQH